MTYFKFSDPKRSYQTCLGKISQKLNSYLNNLISFCFTSQVCAPVLSTVFYYCQVTSPSLYAFSETVQLQFVQTIANQTPYI